jgi:large subunit ribosomal protein L7/L12
VVLYSTSERKLPTIKVIRMLTGLGLKDAKTVVDNAPSIIRTGLSITEASRMKRELEETGASAAAQQLTKREAWCYYTA